MTLLKGDNSIKAPKAMPPPSQILTVSDGLRFGIGFWSALIFAIPVILFILAIVAWVVVMIFGELAGVL